MEQDKGRRSPTRGNILSVAAFFAIIILLGSVFTLMLLRYAKQEFTSFGDEERTEIKKHMGITLTDEVRPVRMVSWNGGGDYDYQLWVEDIADPETFIDSCFDGSYTLLDGVSAGLEEWLSYSENGTTEGATVYECSLTADGYNKFDEYYMAFYRDGDSWKAKIYATKK